MSDILDVIDDLDDDGDEVLEGTLLESEEEYHLSENYEMNEDEAQDITDAIRSAATATYILLAKAHQHKAHVAMGYKTWADYVNKEFDMSSQRSYQLLDLGKTIAEIEAATPEGTVVKLTEAQARDIKRELPRITEEIKEATAGRTPLDAEEEVNRIIEEQREQKRADDAVVNEKMKQIEEAEQEGYQKGIEAAADALLEADRPDGITDAADDGLVEVEVEGENSLTPEDSMNLYNFFNVLSGISSLPEPDDFVEIVPSNRAEEINNQLIAATAWLNRFQTLWEEKSE